MIRVRLVLSTVLAGLSVSGAGALPIPLEAMTYDFKQLQSWGTRKYRMGAQEETGGRKVFRMDSYVVMGTEVQADRILLKEVWQKQGRTIASNIDCRRDGLLSVQQIGVKMYRLDETSTDGTLVVQKGKATGKMGGKDVSISYPSGTLMLAGACRIVTLLPRQKGKQYWFLQYSDTLQVGSDPRPADRPLTLTCAGPFTVPAGGQSFTWTRFDMAVDTQVFRFYVDDQGVLQRVRSDDLLIDLVRDAPKGKPSP